MECLPQPLLLFYYLIHRQFTSIYYGSPAHASGERAKRPRQEQECSLPNRTFVYGLGTAVALLLAGAPAFAQSTPQPARDGMLKDGPPIWDANHDGVYGVSGLTFHDLRGSAVVRLALAEATVPQIATFTGHSLKDVEAILDAHYLGRDIQLAEAAVLKLEQRTKL
jgi:hypothetical protein